MAAVKVDLPLVNSVKSGSVTVNKIMHGQNRIWPMFPIVLKLNDVYYDVTGIQNNEYVKTEVPKTRCILGSVYSAFQTNVQYGFWHTYEFCLTSNIGVLLRSAGADTGDSVRDAEVFYTSSEGSPAYYWDYMAAKSNGSGFNRLKEIISRYNISSIYDSTNHTDIFIVETSAVFNEKKKYIRIKPYGSSTWTVNASRNAYESNLLNTNTYFLFNRTAQGTRITNVYYVKIFDKDKNILGFFHFKQNGDSYGLYDEISKTFLDYHVNNGTVYDFHEKDTFHTDKYIDLDPDLTDYFEVSGSITEGSDTFERLVNNKTGIVLKGIKIES